MTESDGLAGDVRELRERVAALEAQREADRQHDRDSRHALADRTSAAYAELSVRVERGLEAIGVKLTHQDSCTDATRAEARAARHETAEARSAVRQLDERVGRIEVQTAAMGVVVAKLEPLARSAAVRSPIAVGAFLLVDAFGKSRGWWQ